MFFDAPHEVVKAFLDAYVEGDGHRFSKGKVSSTTVSRELAYGVAWLALKCGYFPSIYDASIPEIGVIEGRIVHRAPHQYMVVWHEESSVKRKIIETEKFFLVPIQEIASEHFAGYVFNMEVEDEHNYLAGFFLVSNCQNWLTSQRWLEPPDPRALQRAETLLLDLEALAPSDRRTDFCPHEITPLGRRMLAFPVDPRYARMLLAAQELGCVRPIVLLAALTQGRDLLVRSQGKQVAEARDDLFGGETESDLFVLMRALAVRRAQRIQSGPVRAVRNPRSSSASGRAIFQQFLEIADREGLDIAASFPASSPPFRQPNSHQRQPIQAEQRRPYPV